MNNANNNHRTEVFEIAKRIYPTVIGMVGESGLPRDEQAKLVEEFENGSKTEEEETTDVVAVYTARITFQFAKAFVNQFEFEKGEGTL